MQSRLIAAVTSHLQLQQLDFNEIQELLSFIQYCVNLGMLAWCTVDMVQHTFRAYDRTSHTCLTPTVLVTRPMAACIAIVCIVLSGVVSV